MADASLLERVQGRAARALLQSQLSALRPMLMRGLGARRVGPMLHPELQLLLLLRQLIGFRSWHELSVAAARRQLERESRMAGGPSVQVGAVRELTLQGPSGPLRLRHYVAACAGPRPLLVFYHGGGFVLGSLDSHDQPCRILAKDAGLDVLSVDYRLAPEHPFPAAVEDALAAYVWARENASALGVSQQIAVCGDSAGANLAAVVSLLAKERGLAPPAAQLLLYPTVDRSRSYPSLSLFERGYFLGARDIAWCTAHYAGHLAEHSPQSSPLLAPDLRGVCPAFVVTAGFDPLRDEGDAYAFALRDAGVATLHVPVVDMMHGFINMTGLSPACRASFRDIARRFGSFLRTCAATRVSAASS